MRDWKKLPVNQHGSGITDNIENAPSSFQEACENLTVGRRSGDLETRDGSEYFKNTLNNSLQTPTTIRQLFRLEDYIFAYCYADPVTPGDDIDGQIYWIKEDGSSTAWSLVETARDGFNIGGPLTSARWGYTLSSSKTVSNSRLGEGFVYYWEEPNWFPMLYTVASYLCQHVALGGGGPGFTVATDAGGPVPNNGRLVISLNTDTMSAGRLYTDNTFTTLVTYGDIVDALDTALAPDGVEEYIAGTTSGTALTLNGMFGDQKTTTVGPAGDFLPVFTKEGHLTATEWQGHLYLSLEPYDKSFTYNTDDPDATDPDSFPPDNDREALKKLYIKWEDQIDIPKCTNAQMPKSFTSVQRQHGDTNFNFYEFDLAFLAKTDGDTAQPEEATHKHDDVATGWLMADTDPMLKLWIERGPTAKSVFGDPSGLPIHRDNVFVFDQLIVDIFPSYQYDSTGTPPTLPTVYDEYDTDWAVGAGLPWASYYYDHRADALLVVIPSDFVEDTATGELNDRSAKGENIRDAIELAFANYNARPNTDQTTKGHHAPLNVSTAWRNNLLPSEVVVGQNYNDGPHTTYLWYRDVTTAAGDGGSVRPLKRGIIKTMFVGSKVVLDDQYIESARVTYGYGFYARETYVALVENTPRTFIFDGPSELIQLGTIAEWRAEGNHDQITVLGGLTSSIREATGHVFDFNQFVAVIGRTENGGTVYYNEVSDGFFLPPQLPGTGSPYDDDLNWNDKVSLQTGIFSELADEQLNVLSESYFNGGVLTYDALPQSGGYYFTVVNQVGYYGNIIGANQRVYQSTPGVPHASPATFFDDFSDPISSVNHFLDKALIFTPITTWRIEGIRGATGAGRTFIRLVSDEFGSIANKMVVRTNRGLFYWSKVGIIYTDGLSSIRITDHLIDTYETWLDWNLATKDEIGPAYMRGEYNEKDQRIYWSILDENAEPMSVILDVYGQITNQMPIQTARGHVLKYEDSGGAIAKEFLYDTNVTHYSEKTLRFYRAQNREILIQDKAYPMDEYNVETAEFDLPAGHAITNEVMRLPIKPYMKSIGFSYDSKSVTKWTHRVDISMKEGNEYGVAIRPLGWNDFGSEPHELGGCLNYQNVQWSADYDVLPDPDADLKQYFKHLDVAFLNSHHVTFRRRFPRPMLKNIYKQFGFREHPINTGDITAGSDNVTSITVTQKTTDYIEVRVLVTSLAGNAVLDKGIDSSGAWYMWIDKQVLGAGSWFQIFSVLEETAALEYVLFLKPDDFNVSVENAFTVDAIRIGKVPEEQKMSLLDYEITFAYISDRSRGLFKSPDNGGDNG